jgi:hypothetical protein
VCGESDALGDKRIFKSNDRAPPLESDHGGDAVVNPRHRVVALRVVVHATFDRDERRTDTFLRS